MPVLAQYDDRVVCSSCRFSYPRIRGFCPGCGHPAPEPPANSVAPYLIEAERTQPFFKGGRTRSLALVAASLLLAGALFMARANHERVQQPKNATPATENLATASSAQSASVSLSPAGPHSGNSGVATSLRAKPQNPDQAALWNGVKRGDINAEISLAKYYLDSSSGAQNCEQAHLLLLAASKNHSRVADDLLSGTYIQRCR